MSGLTMLEHERARFAGNEVLQEFGKAISQQDRDLKNYRSVVRSAPLYVRQVGLLQAVAFWLSKGRPTERLKDRPAERILVEHSVRWLAQAESTKFICKASVSPQRDAIRYDPQFGFVSPLLARTSSEIAVLEAEADAILGWLGRITEGLYQSLPKDPPVHDCAKSKEGEPR